MQEEKKVPNVLYTEGKAKEIAEANTKSDGDWTYTVVPYSPAYFAIEVRDEDGFFVGYL